MPGFPARLSLQPGLASSEGASTPPASRQQVSGPILPAGPQRAPAENAEDRHIGGIREGAKGGLGSPLAKRARLSNGVRGVMDPVPFLSPSRLGGEIGEGLVREAEGSDPVGKKVTPETTMVKDQVKQSVAGIDEARRKKKRAAAWLEDLGFEGLEQKVKSQKGPFVPGKSTGAVKQGDRKDEITDADLPFDLLAGTDFERMEGKPEIGQRGRDILGQPGKAKGASVKRGGRKEGLREADPSLDLLAGTAFEDFGSGERALGPQNCKVGVPERTARLRKREGV
jgi:hypothetical protein